jgi:hypothetical protein
MAQVFHHPNKTHIYSNMYFTVVLRGKIKKKRKNDGVDELKSRARRPSQNLVPWTSARGQCFLQALQDEVDRRQDIPS